MKPVTLLYGFPNTGPKFSTKPPGICILRPLSDDCCMPRGLPFIFPRFLDEKFYLPLSCAIEAHSRPESLESSGLPSSPHHPQASEMTGKMGSMIRRILWNLKPCCEIQKPILKRRPFLQGPLWRSQVLFE